MPKQVLRFHFMTAIANLRHIKRCGQTGFFLIVRTNCRNKVLHRIFFHQTDRAATESCTRHAGANHTVYLRASSTNVSSSTPVTS